MGTNDMAAGGAKYSIENLRIHEQFSKPYHDIAVLKVRGKIEFYENVQPIKYSAGKKGVKICKKTSTHNSHSESCSRIMKEHEYEVSNTNIVTYQL